jgi:hypothetical protein
MTRERIVVLAVLLTFTFLTLWLVDGMETAEAERDDYRRSFEQVTSAPTITQRVTVPPKIVTKTITVERVIERSSRNLDRSKRPSKNLDLSNARLWDRIAECESSGNWSKNTGSFDGGLQFLPSTWQGWGGTDFAPYAHLATRAEQITVANRSGKTDPWLKPWPVCGREAAAELGLRFP